MKPMMYLWRTTFKNQLKMSLRKPANLLVFLFIGGYFAMMLWSFGLMIAEHKIQSVDMATILSFFVVLYMPLNLATYARRKGLAFKKCDVNLLFTAPLSPKLVLVSAKIRTLWSEILLSIFVFVAGIVLFDMPFWKMLLYFLFTMGVKEVLESSVVLILYTSEKMTEKQRKVIATVIYVILALFIVCVGICVLTNDFEVLSARKIMENKFFQLIPLIGWNVSFIFLLFSGVTSVNVTGTILYFLTAVILFVIAKRMKCEGGYYEDAMKFADDYEEALKRSKKGEVAVIGKKKKYQHKSIKYKGTGAKAIFYRQILEYKKNRWFIFGFTSLLYLIIGVGFALMAIFVPEFADVKEYGCLIVPAVVAYISFITSGYRTKWSQELEHPLTFLMPDGAIKKLWYATLVEHIRGLCNGLLVTIPVAIAMQMELVYVILAILCCVFWNAGLVYSELLARFLSGKNSLGFLQTIIKMFFEVILLCFSGLGAFLGGLTTEFANMLSVMIGLNLMLFISVLIIALLSSFLFDRMDCAE